MSNEDLYIKMIITAWQTQNSRVDKLLEKLSAEQWANETAPGRNSGIYLLGHLAAVNDAMFPLLGFGEKLYPELEAVFLSNPDKSGIPKPPLDEIKKYWHQINTRLTEHVLATSPAEWLSRHNAVSEEDFAREPHRNKLNIIINRTGHQAYHVGQLTYLS